MQVAHDGFHFFKIQISLHQKVKFQNSKFENQAILEFSNHQKPENKSSKNHHISILGF
jgi:hypothetical protein